MNVWLNQKWRSYYDVHPHRSGLRVTYDSDIHPEVKRACKAFVAWLRTQYEFPQRIRMYVKAKDRIRARDGTLVCGTFLGPYNRSEEPYIRIAVGDYLEIADIRGKDNALASILGTIAHELTHYFQWLNDMTFTAIGEERQATNYSRKILSDYAETRDHP